MMTAGLILSKRQVLKIIVPRALSILDFAQLIRGIFRGNDVKQSVCKKEPKSEKYSFT